MIWLVVFTSPLSIRSPFPKCHSYLGSRQRQPPCTVRTQCGRSPDIGHIRDHGNLLPFFIPRVAWFFLNVWIPRYTQGRRVIKEEGEAERGDCIDYSSLPPIQPPFASGSFWRGIKARLILPFPSNPSYYFSANRRMDKGNANQGYMTELGGEREREERKRKRKKSGQDQAS